MIAEVRGTILETKCQHCGKFCRIDILESTYLFTCTSCKYTALLSDGDGPLDVWDVNNTLEMEI